MRITLSYATEFDKGEGVHFARVLRRMGHDVDEVNIACEGDGFTRGARAVRGFPSWTDIEELQAAFQADLFLYIEPMGLIPRGLERAKIPTACVISDVHRNLRARQRLGRLFDHVFLYQRNYLDHFNDRPAGSRLWLPYACDTEFFRDLGMTRDLDVGFVGQLPKANGRRRAIVDAISRRYTLNEQRHYFQDEIPGIYSRAKIVVNIPVSDDLNFRFFEALSCGALLLTPCATNGQENLFSEGQHYVAYESQEDLFEKLDHYLANDEDRGRIAAAGYQEVIRRHSLEHRCSALLEAIRSGPAQCAPVRQMNSAAILNLYGQVYEREGRVEALLRLAAEQGRLSARRASMLLLAFRSFGRRATIGW